jgi:anti-sigma B factor antagonist
MTTPPKFSVPQLSIECQRTDRVQHVSVAGELDIATADRLRGELLDAGHNGTDMVVLDLRAVTFIDSAGLRAIIEAAEGLHRHECGLRLIRGTDEVQRVLSLRGVAERLSFIEDDG